MLARECDCKEFQDSGHTDECNNHYKGEVMKVYSCTFSGHWPVGAAAIIVAPDKDAAKALMKTALKEQGLDVKNPDLELIEVDKKTMAVHILLNGDY